MVDREKVTNVLAKRFPTASAADIAAAANAIMGLGHEYVAVDAAMVREFHCAAPNGRYTLSDLTDGRVRIFARAAERA